jgi:L-lactate utilization protein LutC
MQNPIDIYWQKRLEAVGKALEANNFEVFIVQTASEAKDLVLTTLMPQIAPKVISWGGSMTLGATGIMEAIKNNPDLSYLDPYEPGLKPEEAYEKRRQGLLVDLFFSGTNALTEQGQLVNLDATGNRVGAITFGPKNVIVVIGRNKVVSTLDAAMDRIKEYAAPINAIRLKRKTPCTVTAYCEECKSPGRICNVWTITEKSFPKHRVKVILINQDLGL